MVLGEFFVYAGWFILVFRIIAEKIGELGDADSHSVLHLRNCSTFTPGDLLLIRKMNRKLVDCRLLLLNRKSK
jgi:hypothetical protein